MKGQSHYFIAVIMLCKLTNKKRQLHYQIYKQFNRDHLSKIKQ